MKDAVEQLQRTPAIVLIMAVYIAWFIGWCIDHWKDEPVKPPVVHWPPAPGREPGQPDLIN